MKSTPIRCGGMKTKPPPIRLRPDRIFAVDGAVRICGVDMVLLCENVFVLVAATFWAAAFLGTCLVARL